MANNTRYSSPDGEIAALAAGVSAPEYTRPAPEFPALGAGAVGAEYTLPPPEFPKGLTTQEAASKKRRRNWKKLLAAALAGVVGVGTLLGAKSNAPGVQPAPGGEPTKPSESSSATEPTVPTDAPYIDIGYALTDGAMVYFSYFVNVPDWDQPDDAQKYWPVTVLPSAENPDGQIAYGEEDVWEYARASQFAYEFSVPAELGTELTLTIAGEYELDGETRTVSASCPIGIMPAGEADAFLWVLNDGTAEFKSTLITREGDEHVYDLEPMMLVAQAFDAEQQSLGQYWALDDLAELEPDYFDEPDFGEYVFYRAGELGEAPAGAKYCQCLFYLRDRTNGYIYQLKTNICPLPAAHYALGDETIQITVYNDTTIYEFPSLVEDDGYLTILMKQTLNAADFTELTLPAPLPPTDYVSTGYVVHYGSPFDNGYTGESPFSIYEGDPPVEALITEESFAFRVYGYTLTKEMVERVPVSADGVRYVNLHATFNYVGSSPDFWVDLDDGEGNVTEYPVASPIASEAFFYTCAFPEPAGPFGYYFDGWYTEDGQRVDMLMDYFSFVTPQYDEDGNFLGYDWSTSQRVRLIAHWLPF